MVRFAKFTNFNNTFQFEPLIVDYTSINKQLFIYKVSHALHDNFWISRELHVFEGNISINKKFNPSPPGHIPVYTPTLSPDISET